MEHIAKDVFEKLYLGGKILSYTRRSSLGFGVHEVVFRGGVRVYIVVDTKTYIKY